MDQFIRMLEWHFIHMLERQFNCRSNWKFDCLLPSWIERWLGLETASGEGTAWNLQYNWPWPSWITLLAAVLAAMFVVWIYLREGRQSGRGYRLALAGVRLSLVALALVTIAQLALVVKRTGLPFVALLVDDSESMTIADRYEGKMQKELEERVKKALSQDAEVTRWNLLCALLCERDAAMLRELGGQYKLRVYFLTGVRLSRGQDAEGAAEEIKSVKPTGEASRIGAAVRDVLDDLRGAVPAGIVIFSDGINTEGPSLADAAAYSQRRGAPLFCVGLGSSRPMRDLSLSDLVVDDVVFVDDAVNFECKLSAAGFQGGKAAVVLREKGKSDVLAKTEVTLGQDDQTQTVRLVYRPTEAGRFEYEVEVEPQEGELQTENNRLMRTVQVRKEKLRVLLAQSGPSFEFRYLRNVLERDDTIELHTVLQESDLEHAEQDKAALRMFPERREDLFAYDVIILGDLNPAFLSASTMQSLAAFVDQPGKGGALVLIAGPKYMPLAYRDTPLARLMPINPAGVRLPDPNRPVTEGFELRPTDLGLAAPAHATGRFAGRDAGHLAKPAGLVLVCRGGGAEAGRPGAGRTSHADHARRPAAAHIRDAIRGRGQGALARQRRNLALAVAGGRLVFRPLLGTNDSLPEPVETVRGRPRRHAYNGPPAVLRGRGGARPRAVRRRAACPGRRQRRNSNGRAAGSADRALAVAAVIAGAGDF